MIGPDGIQSTLAEELEDKLICYDDEQSNNEASGENDENESSTTEDRGMVFALRKIRAIRIRTVFNTFYSIFLQSPQSKCLLPISAKCKTSAWPPHRKPLIRRPTPNALFFPKNTAIAWARSHPRHPFCHRRRAKTEPSTNVWWSDHKRFRPALLLAKTVIFAGWIAVTRIRLCILPWVAWVGIVMAACPFSIHSIGVLWNEDHFDFTPKRQKLFHRVSILLYIQN